jgi:hypothetical protein
VSANGCGLGGPRSFATLFQGRSGDGTSFRFVLRRGAWVARFPGERSLSLGTPGLPDERPVGLWAIEGGLRLKAVLLMGGTLPSFSARRRFMSGR